MRTGDVEHGFEPSQLGGCFGSGDPDEEASPSGREQPKMGQSRHHRAVGSSCERRCRFADRLAHLGFGANAEARCEIAVGEKVLDDADPQHPQEGIVLEPGTRVRPASRAAALAQHRDRLAYV